MIAGQTPLFYAAREGHLDMCKVLIDAGADALMQDNLHKTPTHYAKKFQNNEVVEYLTALKEVKRVSDSRQDSNMEDKVARPKKRKDINTIQTKATYKLFRSDNLGNTTELSTS